MPCGWEGKRRFGVALAIRHRLQWFIHPRADGLIKGDKHPTYTPHGVWHSFYVRSLVCRWPYYCPTSVIEAFYTPRFPLHGAVYHLDSTLAGLDMKITYIFWSACFLSFEGGRLVIVVDHSKGPP